MIGPDQEWRNANRANWDERVAIHLAAECYDLAPLRAGRGRLNPIEEAELGPVDGLRVLHLQCHFGRDSLILAQRGARVVGIDFSGPAIAAARNLAAELGLGERARFVEADLYAAPSAVPEPGSFDLAFVTWGAINWLPDIRRWAEIVAWFLQPGGDPIWPRGIRSRSSSTTRRPAMATCPDDTRRISIASRWSSTIRPTMRTRRRGCKMPGRTSGSIHLARSSADC